MAKKDKQEEAVFTRESLIQSQALSKMGLHRDVLTAILKEGSYTLEDAVGLVEKFKQAQ